MKYNEWICMMGNEDPTYKYYYYAIAHSEIPTNPEGKEFNRYWAVLVDTAHGKVTKKRFGSFSLDKFDSFPSQEILNNHEIIETIFSYGDKL